MSRHLVTDSTGRAYIALCSTPPPLNLDSMNTPTTKRFRHAVGSVDTDSEEDTEIDTLATSTPAGVKITHQAFPAKRLKTNHSDGQAESAPHNIAVEGAVEHPHSQENPEEEKRRKNQVRFSQ